MPNPNDNTVATNNPVEATEPLISSPGFAELENSIRAEQTAKAEATVQTVTALKTLLKAGITWLEDPKTVTAKQILLTAQAQVDPVKAKNSKQFDQVDSQIKFAAKKFLSTLQEAVPDEE